MRILLILLFTQMSYASFYSDSLEVNKEYSIQSGVTRTDARYVITVKGEYSQWGSSVIKGKGNDAVWYNEVPRYGIPILDNLLRDMFVEPIWFGDSTVFSIPIVNEQFSMIDYLGFRFNGNPLPPLDRDTISHTYQIEIKGTGEPLKFELWDYAYDTETNRRKAKYSDNQGMLYINVEEIVENDNTNCGYLIVSKNKTKSKVLLRAKIDEKLESEISVNGKPTEILDIICGEEVKAGSKNYYLIDNSFSMYNPISFDDLTPKIDLFKSIDSKLFGLAQSDYYLFSEGIIKKVELDKISSQNPAGNTELYSSLIQMIDIAEEGGNIILITDSYGSSFDSNLSKLIDKIKERLDLSFFALVLVNEANKKDQNSLNEILEVAKEFSFLRIATVTNTDNFISEVLSLQSLVFNDDCCTAIIEIEACRDIEEKNVHWINGSQDYYFQIPCEEIGFAQNTISKRIINNDNIDLSGKLVYDIYGNQLRLSSTIQLNNGIYLILDTNSKYHEIINIRR